LFYVYILYSQKHDRFYIGQCNNINTRLEYHNGGSVRSTKAYAPWELVGFIVKQSRSEAMILERKLKNQNRNDLKRFILKYFKKEICF
jgi:putative endonuclease